MLFSGKPSPDLYGVDKIYRHKDREGNRERSEALAAFRKAHPGVRIKDFRTKAEAEAALAQVIKLDPNLAGKVDVQKYSYL